MSQHINICWDFFLSILFEFPSCNNLSKLSNSFSIIILSPLIFVDIRLLRSMFTRGAHEILQASSTDSFALVERWSSAGRVKTVL